MTPEEALMEHAQRHALALATFRAAFEDDADAYVDGIAGQLLGVIALTLDHPEYAAALLGAAPAALQAQAHRTAGAMMRRLPIEREAEA